MTNQPPNLNRRSIYIADLRRLQRILDVLPVSATIDQPAIERSLGLEGAAQVAEMGFNWVYIDFFDGFPPDQTATDEAFFESAVHYFHEHNIKVSAGIRVASAFAVGSYAQQTWYARDVHHQLLPAGAKRFYTIINHPLWIEEVQKRIETALKFGVDGIVLRELSMGSDGYTIGGLTVGTIGSLDADTQAAYLADSDAQYMPFRWRNARRSQPYFSWRAKRLYDVVAGWLRIIHEENKDCVVEIELRDPLLRPSFATQGVDIGLYEAIKGIQILSTHPDHDSAWWVHNVLVHGLVHRYLPTIKVGLDEILYHTSRVPPPQSYAQGLARAIAQGDAPIVQSIIKRHNNMLSSVLHRRYLPYQHILSALNRWQIAHQDWLNRREPASPLAIYLPTEAQHTMSTSVMATVSMLVHSLMVGGYPIRFVDDTNWQGTSVLLVPPIEVTLNLASLADSGTTIIGVGRRLVERAAVVWPHLGRRSLPLGWPPFVLKQLNRWGVYMARQYHKRHLVRWVFDWLKRRAFVQRRLQPVKLPSAEMINALSAAIPAHIPYVEATVPILYTIWREPDGKMQHHIVNTTRETQMVTLHLHQLVSAEIYPVDAPVPPTQMVGSALTVSLDVAKVIRTLSATIQSTDVER